MGGGKARTIGAAGAALLLAAGCFFTPREAEDPKDITIVTEPAKSPEEVISKLENSFLTWNTTQFVDLMTDDYIFHPDRSDSSDFADAGVFPFAAPWAPADEEIVFNRIFACFNDGATKNGNMLLSYTGDQVFTDSSVTGFSTFESDYTIGVYYVHLQTSEQDSVKFDGALKLFIRDTGGGTYEIYRWEDFRKGSFPTWGYYKGQVAANQDYCPE